MFPGCFMPRHRAAAPADAEAVRCVSAAHRLARRIGCARLDEGLQPHVTAGVSLLAELGAVGLGLGSRRGAVCAVEIGQPVDPGTAPGLGGGFDPGGSGGVGLPSRSDGPVRLDGRMHDLADVFVADGSLLPTPPGVNPMLSILGISHLLAERIAEKLLARQPAAR